MKLFCFSIVSFENAAGQFVNLHGTIAAKHQEYARREAVKVFHQQHRGWKIRTVGVVEVHQDMITYYLERNGYAAPKI